VDLLVHLYARVLRTTPSAPLDPHRDYLLLSKGHAVPALYATLAEFGFFDPQELRLHLSTEGSIYWHPSPAVPGVEFHSGSLGHGLAVGLGIALDMRIRRSSNRVFVVVGDGELDEGSVWEAALIAAARKLDNLVVIVDRNGLQANAPTERLVPLEPLTDKLEAFGWNTLVTNGHDFDALESAFAHLPLSPGRPTAIIAKTVRGKGLPSLQGRAEAWFVKLDSAELGRLLSELGENRMGRFRS
jgi:transketolase